MPDGGDDDILDDEEPKRAPADPGEVGTSFATKGVGWSDRDREEND